MKRYAFPTEKCYSAVYDKLKSKGYEVAVPIFSYSGIIEITTNADELTFKELYKEATGIDYASAFSNNDQSQTKK